MSRIIYPPFTHPKSVSPRAASDEPLRIVKSALACPSRRLGARHFVPGRPTSPLANIKVATFDGQRLRYAGAVGTGFSERVAETLRAKLDSLRTPRCAVPGLKVSGAVWVAPDLKAEIAYRGVTTAGELRHASFKGLAE